MKTGEMFRVKFKITMTGYVEIEKDSETKNMQDAVEACRELYSRRDVRFLLRQIGYSVEVDDEETTLDFEGASDEKQQ